jgi:hypothetical protein
LTNTVDGMHKYNVENLAETMLRGWKKTRFDF